MVIKPEILAFFGGKKYTILWVAFLIATACLFININGKVVAPFIEWAGFVGVIFGFYYAAEVKEKKDILVEQTKIEVAKMEVTGGEK